MESLRECGGFFARSPGAFWLLSVLALFGGTTQRNLCILRFGCHVVMMQTKECP
jgi:hypothetical protein